MSYYVGIDLHSNNFTCCFLPEEGKGWKKTYSIPEGGIDEFLTKVESLGEDVYVMLEASTNSFAFHDRIKHYVKKVLIANTFKMKQISHDKRKTDKIDSEKLSVELIMQEKSKIERTLPVYVPDQKIRDLRSLFTTYNKFKEQKGALKNRIHSLLKQVLLPQNGVNLSLKKERKRILELDLPEIVQFQIELLFEELDHVEGVVQKFREKIEVAGAPFYEEINILCSINGISVFAALAILSDVGDVSRFSSAKKFTSYLRSAPGVDGSNDTIKNLGTRKQGRKLSLTILTQCLIQFYDQNTHLCRWFERLKARGKSNTKARMAYCRKIFTVMYSMLKNRTLYRYRIEALHERKMEDYRNLLAKHNIHVESQKIPA